MTDVEQIRNDADAANRRRESEEAGLYRQDGSKMYSDAAHADQMNELTARRDETVAELQEQADSAVTAAHTRLEAVENRDPIDRLSEDELQRASGRRAFVKEDAEDLPLAELTSRVKTALHDNDPAMITLYGRYAARRADAEREKMRQAGGSSSAADAQALGDLREAVEAATARLNSGGRAMALQAAREKLEEAREASIHVNKRSLTHEERLARSSLPF